MYKTLRPLAILSVSIALPASAQEPAKSIASNWEKELKLPGGYAGTLFAAPPLVNYPVFIAAAPDGTLYVSSDANGSLDRGPKRGSIVRLRDTDGDGRADESKKFVADVDSPRGLVWDHDRVYVMHPPHLSAFIDKDGDGVADEQKVLVKNMAFTFKDRPADHTTNGVTLGIDGWLYVAVGDFGFMEAEGTDGRKLSFRSGGVIRVRPDGTGLEVYSTGTRNILEVALDPLLNGFVRDNTNDGGGWDTRLHHFTGMEDHGYPRLFQNFGDEIIQPLADYGGGSGCGSLFLSEPGFPGSDGQSLFTADWGRSWIYKHELTPKGATFSADQNQFIALPRVTDLDVDAMSRLYAASWKGATFKYEGEDVGYIVQVKPQGYQAEPLPDFEKASGLELVKLLESPSHRRRLEAQRALLRKGVDANVTPALAALVRDGSKPLASRVVAIFTVKQALGVKATDFLAGLTADESIREYALRALTDRLEENANIPAAPILAGLKDKSPRVRNAAVISAARSGNAELAPAVAELLGDEDPIIAHTAVKSLVALKGAAAAFALIDTNTPPQQRAGAMQVLQALHDPAVVDGLVARLEKETDPERRRGLLTALCRLYHVEGQWKGDSWGTRPDTRGPYYQPEEWAQSERIGKVLMAALNAAAGPEAAFLSSEFSRHRIKPGDAVTKLLTLAGTDPNVIPPLILQLAQADSIPANAVPILIQAAGDAGRDDVVRAQAVQALVKTDGADAFRTAFATLGAIGDSKGDDSEVEKAEKALFAAAQLENHHQMIEDLAAKKAGKASLYADAALLKLSSRKFGAPESREMTGKALAEGWQDPQRAIQILKAAEKLRDNSQQEQIVAAMTHANADVAKLAAEVVKKNKIDPEKVKAAAHPSGPAIGTLKVENVIESVLKIQGDRARGEQLFTQAGCVACHTVKQGEPLKGPYLGNIADTYKRRELAEAILLPNKTLAQGFVTNSFTLKDGTSHTGFVTQEAADQVSLRNIAAQEVVLKVSDIAKRETLEISMMPQGLMNHLTVSDLASVLDYLEALAKK